MNTAYVPEELRIVCPDDVSFETDGPSSNGSTVFWTPPMYNGTVMEKVESNYANNSYLEVGQYLVVYNATARDGRVTSCDFYVSVIGMRKILIILIIYSRHLCIGFLHENKYYSAIQS